MVIKQGYQQHSQTTEEGEDFYWSGPVMTLLEVPFSVPETCATCARRTDLWSALILTQMLLHSPLCKGWKNIYSAPPLKVHNLKYYYLLRILLLVSLYFHFMSKLHEVPFRWTGWLLSMQEGLGFLLSITCGLRNQMNVSDVCV